jgi:hypothetical protein
MNVLQFDKPMAAITALTEGVSIRATERLTGIHRDTIKRLVVRVGDGCTKVHDNLIVGLNVLILRLDELRAFVGKKQRRTKFGDREHISTSYAEHCNLTA